MGNTLELIKKVGIVKKVRTKKWKRYAMRWMFSAEEVKTLEKHPENICEAIEKHIKSHPSEFKNINADISRAIRNSHILEQYDGSENDLKEDILFWQFAYGYTVNEYLCYGFIGKDRDERLSFLSDRESVILSYNLNDINMMAVFSDKIATYNKFKKYYGREAVSVEKKEDFDTFEKYKKKHSRFVKKNVFQSCGRSVELIDTDRIKESDEELFEYIISEGKVILEELIIQDKIMSVFNDSSVNTIRCITIRIDKEIQAPFCFMKVGRKGAFIDNGAAGGILIGIDSQTGTLSSDGVDEYGRRYESHPDSGIKFKGFQLPNWEKMIEMCLEMSAMVPEVRWIGWDLAYTDTGWIVVEGNASTEVIGPQSTSLVGIRAEMERLCKIRLQQ